METIKSIFRSTRYPLAMSACGAGFLFLLLFLSRDRASNFSYSNEYSSADDPSRNNREEILLGGLLSSEFDTNSCLGRYQSVLYRKKSHHIPSLALISRLREYELLHRRCKPFFKSFNHTSHHLRHHENDCKYVVWTALSGMGNNLLTMASAFLYALLTNRTLLIQQEDELADLFCEPFPNSSWLLPAGFPVDLAALNQSHPLCFGNMLQRSKDAISSDDFQYVHLLHDYNDHDKLFFCEEHQSRLQDVPWLIIKSDNYFIPSLFSIPLFQEELSMLFPDKEAVFHHLGRYLFHPTNQVWGMITRFFAAYMTKADKLLGIQIRVLEEGAHPLPYVIKQILSCLETNHLLPSVSNGKSIASRKFSISVVVTSLYPQYYEKMKEMYWMNPTATGEVVRFQQPTTEEEQKFGDRKHNMKAWSEIYMLSMCDAIVTSAWSTFGYAAQGLGGVRPWILPKPVNGSVPEPSCIRGISMEPCFHAPPNVRCNGDVEDDFLVRCEDRPWGIKLLNNFTA